MSLRIDNENIYTDDEVAALGPILETLDGFDVMRFLTTTSEIGVKNVIRLHAKYKPLIIEKIKSVDGLPLPDDIRRRSVTKKIEEVEVVQ
jgi:hypothetical protein